MLARIATEVLVILLLLVVNGLFAMSEIAVVTARRVRLEHRAEEGDLGAAAALALAREPAQFLSTVQVGITLVGVLAGAFGGASLSEELAVVLADVPAVAPWADTLAFALVVGAITYLSLIIGELVPKRIALGAPERIAAIVSRPMRLVSRVTAPVVRVLTGSTNVALRLLGVRPHGEPGITEEEIRAVLEQGAESGVVPAAEHEIVESVFRLGDRSARAIMTPRHELAWIDLADEEPELPLGVQLAEERRALYLVCEEDLDHVTGFVHAEDLLVECMSGRPVDRAALRTLARSPLFVPSSLPGLQLVESLRESRQAAAVVLDEYGGVEGVVTLHDVLEALVGELPGVSDVDEGPPMLRRADGSWLLDGSLAIADVEHDLDVELREVERGDYQTLAGFVLAQLGRLPRVGDAFDWQGWRFEVVDMDGRRVDKVLAIPPAGDRS